MKTTYAQQKLAREIAETRQPSDKVDWVALRAENARRAEAAS